MLYITPRLLQKSAATMFTTALGQLSYYNLLDGQSDFLSRFMFGLYMIVMGFLLINMFVAIVIDTYENIIDDETKYSYDKELVDHIWNKFMDVWNKATSKGTSTKQVPLGLRRTCWPIYRTRSCLTKVFFNLKLLIAKETSQKTFLTPKHQETNGSVVSTVATDALVPKHQAISTTMLIKLSLYWTSFIWNYCTYGVQHLKKKIKKWPSRLRVNFIVNAVPGNGLAHLHGLTETYVIPQLLYSSTTF